MNKQNENVPRVPFSAPPAIALRHETVEQYVRRRSRDLLIQRGFASGKCSDRVTKQELLILISHELLQGAGPKQHRPRRVWRLKRVTRIWNFVVSSVHRCGKPGRESVPVLLHAAAQ